MKINKKWKILALSLATLGLITTPIIVATSCSSGDSGGSGGSTGTDQGGNGTATNSQAITKEIIDTNQKFVNEQNKYLDANGYINLDATVATVSVQADSTASNQAPAEETKLASVLNALATNALNAVNELTSVKNKHFANLTTDQIIWLDSYIFKWNNIIENLQSGTVFLGANPISGSQVLSSSSNHILDMIKASFNIYKINPETGDPGTEVDQELLSTVKQRIIDCTKTLNSYLQILKIGKKYGIQPSTIAKKMFLNQMLKAFYMDNLNAFSSETDSRLWICSIKLLIDNPGSQYAYQNNYFTNIAKSIKEVGKVDVSAEMTNLENALNSFIIYYGDSYYNNGYGPEVSGLAQGGLSLSIQSNGETEKTIIATNKEGQDVPIYGLGLTDADLNQKGVGIGFMTINKTNMGALAPFAQIDGNSIYQQLLNNNNSINTSAVEIMNEGINLTTAGIDNMTKIANLVPTIITNGFNNQIYYDPDGLGPEIAQPTSLSGTNFQKLNKWLNQEDFYFGRERLTTEELTTYNDKYWNKPTGELANYKNTIITQGYQQNWENKNTINGLATGTVSGNQALAGAVLSLESYINFKTSTDALYDSLFNPYKDYVISPYNYDVREFVGVGLEGPRGSCQFQYNCDPYYSIQKWSVSSLTVHEGKMGHHTQQEYWTEYMNKDGPGYVFTNTAFHEGWAVFSEWLANEASTYGSNLDPNTSMPNDWLNGNGVVPKYDASKVDEQTAIMNELHGGVYYKFANGTDNSPEKLQNAIKLANMLQYYGFLNEAQLRNMRMAVDVAYHHQGSTKEISQDDSLPFGASINQVRAYMKNNSALGIGDIQSESIRYLVMPSQATGYMLGKMIFEDLYKQVEAKFRKESNNQSYKLINDTDQTKKLFDLMLKNGEIPLEVLQNIVTKEYQLGDGVTTNSSYDWLKKVTSEVPNRVSLNQNNDAAALEQKRGEKYAYTWIKTQLNQMGIKESSDNTIPSRTQPAESVSPTTIPGGSINVYFNPMESAQIQTDLKSDGYYTTQFKFQKPKSQDKHESQNIMVNINGGDKSGNLRDFYIVSHYDTANPNNDGTNDNSSGLAMNLALIEYLTNNPDITKGLDVDLHFLFAGAEEQGVVGSWAWALQYQLDTLKNQTAGMINLDSVAGGDTLYVHSPNQKNAQSTWNTGDLIRNRLNLLSGNKLEIHPQIDPNGFQAGQTGDWSDHAPFYKNGIEVAYIEATNFNIKGFDGYDGYSQTINPEFWKKPDGSTVNLIPSFSVDKENNPIILYIPENYDALQSAGASSCNWGKIWHTDLDLFANYEKFFPGRLQSQMSTVFDTLLTYIEGFAKQQSI